MNNLSMLIEHPVRAAVERGHAEDQAEIERQARKTARAYDVWQEERRKLESMYQRLHGLRE